MRNLKLVLLLPAALLTAAVTCAASAAQENIPSISSAVSDGARFQIVQSPILAKLTFRVDRFTGDTWQFVQGAGGAFAWHPIQRLEAPNDTKVSSKPNYQIFFSGIRANITLMINTNTGASWYIAEDPKEGIFWNPIK